MGDVRYTDAPQRREELLRRLADAGYVASHRLAEELEVSEMTIRRDLQRLADDGLVSRVAGGAALPGRADRAEPFEQRTTHDMREKRAIARVALGLPAVATASSLALDAGTTVAEAAPGLPAGSLVVTHSVPVLTACADRDDLELLGLGGTYQPATRSFAGPATRAGLEALAVDVALISAVAMGPGGLYCANPLDAEAKQLLMSAARRVVLLADHTKVAASAPLRFATWDAVDVLVTDDGVSGEDLAMLRSAAADVAIAPAAGHGA